MAGASNAALELPRQRAHASECAVYSDVPAALSAGLAIECGAFRSRLSPELLVGRDAFYSTSHQSYPAAASLVSFLLDEHGAGAVRALLERSSGVGDLATLDAVSREVLGRTISEAHAAWRMRPPEPWHRVCRPAYQCGAPPLDGAPTVTLVRGVAEEVSRGGVLRTFTVERDAELHVSARAVAPRIEVVSCDRAPGVVDEASATRELDVTAPIGAGRYALWMTGALLHGGDAQVEGELVVELR